MDFSLFTLQFSSHSLQSFEGWASWATKCLRRSLLLKWNLWARVECFQVLLCVHGFRFPCSQIKNSPVAIYPPRVYSSRAGGRYSNCLIEVLRSLIWSQGLLLFSSFLPLLLRLTSFKVFAWRFHTFYMPFACVKHCHLHLSLVVSYRIRKIMTTTKAHRTYTARGEHNKHTTFTQRRGNSGWRLTLCTDDLEPNVCDQCVREQVQDCQIWPN